MTKMTGLPDEFVLDDGCTPGFSAVIDIGERWKELPHAPTRSRGFVLVPGEEVRTGPLRIDADHRLHLSLMRVIESASIDGMDLRIGLELAGTEIVLADVHLGNEQAFSAATECEIALRAYAGREARLWLRCLPGAMGIADGDWLAILNCALATTDRLALARAHSQYTWRLGNESGHFSGVYRDAIYGAGASSPTNAASIMQLLPKRASHDRCPDRVVHGQRVLSTAAPEPGESAFAYAHRLLALGLGRGAISFAERLRRLASDVKKPKLLSLCAGEARIEADVVAEAGVSAEVTLLDLNADLLERAASRFPAVTRVNLWQGTVEALDGIEGQFDVVCFVSGLHHVVALEDVLALVAGLLAPQGELWLIGEQIGRNGNRLWPDAQRVADVLFRALPERLRLNHSTDKLDGTLPDDDYASSCFEGVRSQDIPQALSRYFVPVAEDRRNCFLWRFMDPAYQGNYDLDNPADVALIQDLVKEELRFYAGGGLACELNGVYRNRLTAASMESP